VSGADVTQRVAAIETDATTLLDQLDSAAAMTDPLEVADLLLAASGWGIAAATPSLDQEVPALTVLQSQALHAAEELRRRLATEPFQPDAGDPAVTLRRARARISQLCRWQVPVLVPLTRPTGRGWPPVFGGEALAGAPPATVRSWLDSYALVRRPVAALLDAYDLAEVLDTGGVLDAAAAQLLPPGTVNHNWHGADPDPPAGLVNLVVQRAYQGPPPASVSGLFIDGFTQRTPGRQQDTAVAFHYDEPNSTPPQTLLVAVAPDLTPGRQPGHWDLELLCDTLLATLAMARQRAAAAETATVQGVTVRGMT
jgi:hypothetical protein